MENLNEAAIIPYNFSWRPPTPETHNKMYYDPGEEYAKAFVQSLNKRPKFELPKPTKTKNDLYWQDVMNCTAPIPSFGVKDTRAKDQLELQTKENPIMICS